MEADILPPSVAEDAVAARQRAEALEREIAELFESGGLDLEARTNAAIPLAKQALECALRTRAHAGTSEVVPSQALAEPGLVLPESTRVAAVAALERPAEERAALSPDQRLFELAALRAAAHAVLALSTDRKAELSIARLIRFTALGFLAIGLGVGAYSAYRAYDRWTWGPNLALGKPTRVSSSEGGPTDGATDGRKDKLGFHTREEDSPWLEIDLGAPHTIRRVVVYNRDDCCYSRAVPLEISVGQGAELKKVAERIRSFTVWNATFPPETARTIRLRVGKKTFLHLDEVEVFEK